MPSENLIRTPCPGTECEHSLRIQRCYPQTRGWKRQGRATPMSLSTIRKKLPALLGLIVFILPHYQRRKTWLSQLYTQLKQLIFLMLVSQKYCKQRFPYMLGYISKLIFTKCTCTKKLKHASSCHICISRVCVEKDLAKAMRHYWRGHAQVRRMKSSRSRPLSCCLFSKPRLFF